jgi:hypothetical protein
MRARMPGLPRENWFKLGEIRGRTVAAFRHHGTPAVR